LPICVLRVPRAEDRALGAQSTCPSARKAVAEQFHRWYSPPVEWSIEFTDEFETWWNDLNAEQQVRVNAGVILLQKLGPSLDHPYSTKIVSSRHAEMRELRVQYGGEPYRVLYAFDPRRTAILLLGGKKSGDDRWYKKFVRKADRLFEKHLAQIEKEGRTDG
jgi:hypothetical protein